MWSAGFKRTRIFLGERCLGVLEPGAPVDWSETNSPFEGWTKFLRGQSKTSRFQRRGVTVLLSGALARPALLDPVPGVERKSDWYRIAPMVAADAAGFDEPCVLWADNPIPREPTFVVAMPSALRLFIENQARSYKVSLTGLKPWWATGLEAADKDERAADVVAVQDPDALTIVCGSLRKFSLAFSQLPVPDEEQTETIITRVLSGLEIDNARAVLVRLAGPASTKLSASSPSMTKLDFGATLRDIL